MNYKTAIKRTAPSAPMRWLNKNKLLVGRVLDFGCGRGFDASYFSLEAYDPYWKPEMPSGKFDTITCIYVLNVIEPNIVEEVLCSIKEKLNPNGTAYFVVRRDIEDGQIGRGCIQRMIVLNMKSLRETSSYQIYGVKNG